MSQVQAGHPQDDGERGQGRGGHYGLGAKLAPGKPDHRVPSVEVFQAGMLPGVLAVCGEQLADFAREPHLPGGQHDQVVAGPFQVGDQMRGQHHAHVVLGHGAGQVLQEVPARQRVEAGDRLIQDEQLGPLGDGQGQG